MKLVYYLGQATNLQLRQVDETAEERLGPANGRCVLCLFNYFFICKYSILELTKSISSGKLKFQQKKERRMSAETILAKLPDAKNETHVDSKFEGESSTPKFIPKEREEKRVESPCGSPRNRTSGFKVGVVQIKSRQSSKILSQPNSPRDPSKHDNDEQGTPP
jgi:hypothetical protein